VSPAVALRLDIALGALGLLLSAAAIWAIVLCLRKVWNRARSVSAWTFWLSAVVQLLAWFVIPIVVVKDVVDAAPDLETSSKARILGENISEGMNCTAPLSLTTPAAALVWGVAVWRARKARRQIMPASPT